MAASLVLGAGLAAAETDNDASSRPYPVDKGAILAAPVAEAGLVVKMFSTRNTDFGTGEKEGKEKAHLVAEQMEATAPTALAQSIVNRLREGGAFASVSLHDGGEVPPGAMTLEGEFTVLNPGSRGKRFWIGMGAGRSRICVTGRVADPAGRPLLTFDHCRSGNLGWFGGRAEGMMFTDVAGTAEKVSEFLEGWAQGAYRP